MTLASLVSAPDIAVERTFSPETCPYEIVVIDVTHRCNMGCRNCYIPNRTIPDLDARWLSEIFARLPRGRVIRLVGAEPTMREDLPELIREIRAHHHRPVLVSNGLKLADRAYVRDLNRAGLQFAHLSFNGGFDDDLYEQIDGMRCAERKALALTNLVEENFFVSIGMIVVRGVNEPEVGRVVREILRRGPGLDLHLRAIGKMGRYMENPALSLDELRDVFARGVGIAPETLKTHNPTQTSQDFLWDRLHVQLTTWPDLENPLRGRLTPGGLVAPFMEHVIANDGGY